MSTYYERERRKEWFRDESGLPTIAQHKDDVRVHNIDWSNHPTILAGDTISTSSWEGSGVTLSGASLSSAVTSVTVAGTDGTAKNTVVTAAGETLIRTLKFIGTPVRQPVDDYRNY